MAKFEVGQLVEIAFNPQTRDPLVPNQVNGTAPGRGDYQTKADSGRVLEVLQLADRVEYLVAVHLKRVEKVHGERIEISSVRKRHVSEEGLSAI